MDIKLPSKLASQYHNFSFWDKLFILNYYDNKERKLPKENKEQIISLDIDEQLQKLYSLASDINNFKIEVVDNKFLEKEYENELKALIERGNKRVIEYTQRNKKVLLAKMAEKYTIFLFEEYKHLVEVIKNSSYEKSFKYLMINETLTKIYRKENNNILMSKREINKSINEHMILGYDVLDYIYKNMEKGDSFPKLYFEAVEYSKNSCLSKNEIQIDGLNTFDKGKWIKFDGKENSTQRQFVENVNKLKTLVADTNWCTKNLASSHLSGGDFYVFVDKENSPHLAVKMLGNSIDEVRGILPGQRIEDEYSDVMYEFLTKNKDIKNGDRWLENQKWELDVKKYISLLEKDILLDEEEIIELKRVVFDYSEYRSHGGTNIHYQKLYGLIMEKDYIIDYLRHNYSQNKNICFYIENRDIIADINNVENYEELEKILILLYSDKGIMSGKRSTTIDYDNFEYFKNVIASKLKEQRIIDILSSKVEENGGTLLNNQYIFKDVSSKFFNAEIKNLINTSYIYKRLDYIDFYKELEGYLNYLYDNAGLGLTMIDDSLLKDEIMNKLKEEKIIEMLANKIKIDNQNKLITKSTYLNGQVCRMINGAYIYKILDEVTCYDDVEKVLSYLYSSDKNGYKINNIYIQEKIREKIRNERITELLASKIINGNGELLLEGSNVDNSKVREMINCAYILKKLDNLNSLEEFENITSYLYKSRYEYGCVVRKLDNSHLKKEILEKLDSDRLKGFLCKCLGCSKNELIYCEGKIVDNVYIYENKYVYGYIVLPKTRNVYFGAKAILGTITSRDSYIDLYEKDYKSINYNFPNLIYCGNVILYNFRDLKASGLKRINSLIVGQCNKILLDNLIYASNVKITSFDEIKMDCLEHVKNDMEFNKGRKFGFAKLKIVDGKIEISEVEECDFTSLELVKSIKCAKSKLLSIPSLIEVDGDMTIKRTEVVKSKNLEKVKGDLDLRGAMGFSLTNLNDLKGQLILIHAQCDGLPQSRDIRKKIVSGKSGLRK